MNLRNLTLKYMGWCPGIDAAARFIPDMEINGVLACVGTLYDIGVSIWVSSIFIIFIRYSHGVPSPAYPYTYLFWLGFLLEVDAKLMYLTSFPPEFFNRTGFRPERFAMMIGGTVCGAGLLYYVFCRQIADPRADLLISLCAGLPVIPYRVKFEKKLREHSKRDVVLNGFYSSSLFGQALLKIGLGPVIRRSFI